MAPTIHREGPYRFFFSRRGNEPAHVHVRGGQEPVWLHDNALAQSSVSPITSLRIPITKKPPKSSRGWDDYFASSDGSMQRRLVRARKIFCSRDRRGGSSSALPRLATPAPRT